MLKSPFSRIFMQFSAYSAEIRTFSRTFAAVFLCANIAVLEIRVSFPYPFHIH